MNKVYYSFLLLLLNFFSVHAEKPDSIRISLMTCSPGEEIYTLFGHTAIRYENFTRGEDWVFNYGMFSFSTPNFVLRFIKGETDYELGVIPYRYFESEYAVRGSSVYQQVLNLTPAEKLRLLALLEDNYRPENRVYRYNYFYDNCTTRARDRIEQAIDGTVLYASGEENKTFRSIVHEFTAGSAWDELGIDLCLGREADRPIGERLQMFAPFYMKDYASGAYIVSKDGIKRPLVKEKFKAVDVEPEPAEKGFPLSPMMCASLFLAVCVMIGWIQWKRQRIYWGWNVLLMLAQGLAGCIISFLFFCSVHPTVGSNWLLILFNPLPLCYIPFMVWKAVKKKKDGYYVINVVYLTLFIVIVVVCGQKINLSVLPLALGLLVNSASQALVLRKK